jgi:hypothetical protein
LRAAAAVRPLSGGQERHICSKLDEKTMLRVDTSITVSLSSRVVVGLAEGIP